MGEYITLIPVSRSWDAYVRGRSGIREAWSKEGVPEVREMGT